jgi:AbrB family looped-hinge helix DNA binding protein
MTIAKSKLTAQGQISVPAAVRRKLGIAPGSTIEWEERNGELVVRAEKKYTSRDVHLALFPEGPPRRRSLKELKEGIAEYVREQHARGRY